MQGTKNEEVAIVWCVHMLSSEVYLSQKQCDYHVSNRCRLIMIDLSTYISVLQTNHTASRSTTAVVICSSHCSLYAEIVVAPFQHGIMLLLLLCGKNFAGFFAPTTFLARRFRELFSSFEKPYRICPAAIIYDKPCP